MPGFDTGSMVGARRAVRLSPRDEARAEAKAAARERASRNAVFVRRRRNARVNRSAVEKLIWQPPYGR